MIIDRDELERRQYLWTNGYWEIPEGLDTTNFDFNWRPNPKDRPYIHEFGTQWQRTGGPRFVVPHDEGIKYQSHQRAIKLPDPDRFKILVDQDTLLVEFDYSWHPDANEPPFIWIFGNARATAESQPTVEYRVAGATDHKFCHDQVAKFTGKYYKTLIPIVPSSFDYSWVPEPWEPPYIYTWGNQWNDATVEPTIEYHMPGATERKYILDVVPRVPAVLHDCWRVPNLDDLATFDFSWRPNPYADPQIYQWENNGPVYTVPGAATVTLMPRDGTTALVNQYYITTTLEDLILEHPREVFWALNPELNYDGFDFTWRPTPENFRHINVFGNKTSKDTNTYYVNAVAYNLGQREYNYIEDDTMQIVTDIDMFYVSRGNVDTRYEALLERFPRLQKTRYVGTWIGTINRCIKKAGTKLIWILSSEVDYTDFKFDYYPSTWNREMIHVFGTQWSQWGNTYIVNTETFAASTHYLEHIEHAKNINLVRTRRTKLVDRLHDIVYIDHGNPTDTLDTLRTLHPDATITTVKYDTSYLQTLRNYADGIGEYEIRREHWVWVCSSMCDYSGFDFTWAPDPFQREHLHVFASKSGTIKQKFGDTFLLNLAMFKTISNDFSALQDYTHNVNYINYLTVPRVQHPVIEHDYDSQAEAVHNFVERHWPYYEMINTQAATTRQSVVPVLWDSATSDVIVTGAGASRIILPDGAIDRIREEVYDYKHIQWLNQLDPAQPLDIVFFSNGEPGADENYEYLLSLELPNRIHHSANVKGRVNSQQRAALLSKTSWYFLVNAKLRVNPLFDFAWQPDRLQKPKHYIFTATNPVNGLEYGHQAIVANNQELTLATAPNGLDFTMASSHEVVEMNSGIGYFNTDSWTTWRTAFRECIKLRNNTDAVSQERLEAWQTIGHGDNAEWSIRGAQDGVEYWESVNGDMDKLMLSYDWDWIREWYISKYR